MSTSKYFNKICIVVVILMLGITFLFMNGNSIGIHSATRNLGYENKLFDTTSVHSIDIVMNDWDSFIENCESEEYSSCTLVIDGEKYSNIGIRAKGNTSLTTVKSLGSDRYSFKLEFDHYKDGNSYYGLDKLCLNNLIQDNTMMKDYIVYQMMNQFGVESPLCSFVYITVNGEDWGLYLAVEGVEDGFMERNYGSDSGELYKPDSTSMNEVQDNQSADNKEQPANTNEPIDGTTSATQNNNEDSTQPEMPDGTSQNNANGNPPEIPDGTSQDNTNGNPPEMPDGTSQNNKSDKQQGGMGSDDIKLKYIDDDADSYPNIFDNAKTDISDSDKERLIASLKNLSEYTDLEDTINIDEVMRYFIVHNFVCNGDSYTGNMIHNYYLHENDGILSMIPWDYNLAFGTFEGNQASSSINASIDNPISGDSGDDRPMFGWIESSDEYIEEYHELFSEFITTYFSNDELVNMIKETADLILPYVEKDPTKFCTVEEFEKGVDTLTNFVTLRSQAVENQLNGDTTTVDAGNLNLSDMGSMNSGMNQKGQKDDSSSILSRISITDKDGNAIDISSLINDVSDIVSITLSDGTTLNTDQVNMQTDLSKITSFTDSLGIVTDLSSYTISMEKGNKDNLKEDMIDTDHQPEQETSNISIYTWIYLGISIFLLFFGIIFAYRKYK